MYALLVARGERFDQIAYGLSCLFDQVIVILSLNFVYLEDPYDLESRLWYLCQLMKVPDHGRGDLAMAARALVNGWALCAIMVYAANALLVLARLVRYYWRRYMRIYALVGKIQIPPNEWTKTLEVAYNIGTQPHGSLMYVDNLGLPKFACYVRTNEEQGQFLVEMPKGTPEWFRKLIPVHADLKESRNPARKASRYYPRETKLPIGYMFDSEGTPIGGYTRIDKYLVTTRHNLRKYEDGQCGKIKISRFNAEGVIGPNSPGVWLEPLELQKPVCKKSQNVEDLIWYNIPSDLWDRLGVPKGSVVNEIANEMAVMTLHVEFVVNEKTGGSEVHLFQSACEIVPGFSVGRRYHNGDTAKGDCGFPVLKRDHNTSKTWKVVGIHKEGSMSPPPNIRNGFTSAAYLRWILSRLDDYEVDMSLKEEYKGKDDDRYEHWMNVEIEERDDDYDFEIDEEFGRFKTPGRRAKRKQRALAGRYLVDPVTGREAIVSKDYWTSRAGARESDFKDFTPEQWERVKRNMGFDQNLQWDQEGPDGLVPIRLRPPPISTAAEAAGEKEGPKQYDSRLSPKSFLRRQIFGGKPPVVEIPTETVDKVLEEVDQKRPSYGKNIAVIDNYSTIWTSCMKYRRGKLVNPIMVLEGAEDLEDATSSLETFEQFNVVEAGLDSYEYSMPWDDLWGQDIPEDKLDAWKQVLWTLLLGWELNARMLDGRYPTLLDFMRSEFTSPIDGRVYIGETDLLYLTTFVGSVYENSTMLRDFFDRVFMQHERIRLVPTKTRLEQMVSEDFIQINRKEGPKKTGFTMQERKAGLGSPPSIPSKTSAFERVETVRKPPVLKPLAKIPEEQKPDVGKEVGKKPQPSTPPAKKVKFNQSNVERSKVQKELEVLKAQIDFLVRTHNLDYPLKESAATLKTVSSPPKSEKTKVVAPQVTPNTDSKKKKNKGKKNKKKVQAEPGPQKEGPDPTPKSLEVPSGDDTIFENEIVDLPRNPALERFSNMESIPSFTEEQMRTEWTTEEAMDCVGKIRDWYTTEMEMLVFLLEQRKIAQQNFMFKVTSLREAYDSRMNKFRMSFKESAQDAGFRTPPS